MPENWSGRVEIVSALDGRVTNAGVARYRELEGRHLEPVLPRTFGPDVIALMARTCQSRIYVAEAARTKVYSNGVAPEVEQDLYQMEDYIQQVLSFDVREGVPVRVEKMVGFYTSRDYAMSEPLGSAGNAVRTCPSFSDSLADHRQVWNELWEMCGLVVACDPAVQLRLRLHASHVLQVCSGNTAEVDSGVVARGLNGEAYRGHVFWDELFVLLYLSFRMPRVTRHLLLYRARRLGEARRAAQAAGFRGAMYPWQSGSDGKEETQVVHLNPLSGRWEPDLSHNQRHVNAAIFYSIWHYYRVTGDGEFMVDHGAEMMLEIARFWGSLASVQPRARPLRDPRGDGPGRVPRELPRRRRWRLAQQCIYQRHGGVDLPDRPEGARVASRGAGSISPSSDRPDRRRDRQVGAGEPEDVRAVPRRGHHQPVRGIWPAGRARLGRLPRALRRQDPAARPHPSSGERRSQPLQDVQAGRYCHALLSVLGRGARRAVREARLRICSGHARARTSTTTTAGPPTGRRSASSPTPAPSRRWTPRAPGSGSWWPSTATSPISRGGRRKKAFTWG